MSNTVVGSFYILWRSTFYLDNKPVKKGYSANFTNDDIGSQRS